jgi:hypothetical protein
MKKEILKKKETFSEKYYRESREKYLESHPHEVKAAEQPEKMTIKEFAAKAKAAVGKSFEWMKEKISDAVNHLNGNTITVDDDTAEYSYFDRGLRRTLDRIGGAMLNEKGQIVLTVTVVTIKTLIAVMNLTGSKADIAKKANDIITASAASSLVTVPLATITILRGLATTYLGSTPGTEQAAWLALNNGMKGLMTLFQAAANGSPSTANAIILSGGFKVKRQTERKKQAWSVKNNPVVGVLDLLATGARGRVVHDWWVSLDGKVFTRLDPTVAANTQVSGYASGITLYFMHQLITKDGPQGFDAVLKIVVA